MKDNETPMQINDAKTIKEIAAIKRRLDEAHDTDPDYLPPHLRELRSYIFQVHASYETSMEIIIWKDYIKSPKNFWDFNGLFERMTFEDKRRIVHSVHANFPNHLTRKLNELRNDFAHRKGDSIRNEYDTNPTRLDAYRLIDEAHSALNQFVAASAGIE